jgi:hypothetical protein
VGPHPELFNLLRLAVEQLLNSEHNNLRQFVKTGGRLYGCPESLGVPRVSDWAEYRRQWCALHAIDKELFRRVHKRTRQRLHMRSGSIANDVHQNGTLWNEGDLVRHTRFILEFPHSGGMRLCRLRI